MLAKVRAMLWADDPNNMVEYELVHFRCYTEMVKYLAFITEKPNWIVVDHENDVIASSDYDFE